VDVQDALHNFEGQVLDVVRVHLLSIVPDDIHQVLRAVLRDEIERIEISAVTWPHNGLQLDNVLVSSEYAEKSNFSEDTVSVDVTLEDVLDFLDGDNFLVLLLL